MLIERDLNDKLKFTFKQTIEPLRFLIKASSVTRNHYVNNRNSRDFRNKKGLEFFHETG